MQARYYDPVIGRFYSNDPVDASTFVNRGDIQGFNRYAYTFNNPYSYTDPDGATPAHVAWAVGWGIYRGYKAYKAYKKLQKARKALEAAGALSEAANEAQESDREAGPDGKRGSTGGPGAGKRFKPETPEERADNEGAPCRYCGTETTNEPGHPNSRERDHIDPKSRGGNNTPENEGQSCRTCNRSKGARNPDEWEPKPTES